MTKKLSANQGLGLEDIISKILENYQIDLPEPGLPEPDMVNFWKFKFDRKFFLDYCIDSTVLALEREILMCNLQDKGIPVEERKPITIYIMSPGGDVDYMYSLVDVISLSETPIYTVNIGSACSAAALIFMSGHKRFMLPYAKVLIHEGSASMEGDAGKIMDATESYKKDLKKMKDYIMSRTEIPKSLLYKKRANDWTLTAEECLNYKVCHRVIESLDEVL